jgi:hypothetical protein
MGASYVIVSYGGVRIFLSISSAWRIFTAGFRVRNYLHWAFFLTRTHALILSDPGFRNTSEGVSMIKNRHAMRGSGLQTRDQETM